MKVRRPVGMVAGVLIAVTFAPAAAGADELDDGPGAYTWYDCGIGCGETSDFLPGVAESQPVPHWGKTGYLQVMARLDGESYCEVHEVTAKSHADPRAYVTGGGLIRFTAMPNADDGGTVRWRANQDDGATQIWTFNLSQDACTTWPPPDWPG